jgi:hypothetical protein
LQPAILLKEIAMKKVLHVALLTLALLGAFATPLLADGTEPGPITPVTLTNAR